MPAKWRELSAISCLAGQIVFPQLHSHVLGAMNTGCTLEDVRGTLDQTGYRVCLIII
jgi:alkylhydroperoxidase/carboxymuconolactone decarboxylase family protein YurZ